MDIAEVYNKIASEFDNTRHYKWPFITDFINNISGSLYDFKYNIETKNNQKLETPVFGLDIGCGNGRNIEAYTTNNISIIGIDSSIEFVKLCCKKGLHVSHQNMIKTDFQNETFDFILMIASFHHLDNEKDRLNTLNEMKRILKPDGQILLSVWSKKQPTKTKRKFSNYGDTLVPWKCKNGEIINRYYYIFITEELVNMIERCGFKIKHYSWECGNEVYILNIK